MIQLTQKGKEIYGDRKIQRVVLMDGIIRFGDTNRCIIASNALELKALLDMGLIEIK